MNMKSGSAKTTARGVRNRPSLYKKDRISELEVDERLHAEESEQEYGERERVIPCPAHWASGAIEKVGSPEPCLHELDYLKRKDGEEYALEADARTCCLYERPPVRTQIRKRKWRVYDMRQDIHRLRERLGPKEDEGDDDQDERDEHLPRMMQARGSIQAEKAVERNTPTLRERRDNHERAEKASHDDECPVRSMP